mgnify:CR=1 FL=1
MGFGRRVFQTKEIGELRLMSSSLQCATHEDTPSVKVVVRRVTSKADQRCFFEFPWKLYEDDPHWIPQLPSMRRDTLDKQKHPAWEYMTGDYFVAYHNGETVGTIAAFVNHRHNKFHDEHIGFFGFFGWRRKRTAAV